MTTVLQSCLETQFMETTTTLKLKVASKTTSELLSRSTMNSCNYAAKTTEMNSNSKALYHDSRDWSFLQVLSNVSSSSNPKETMEEEKNVYVHPLTKQYSSSSRLSEKSLELCTENLGSETGSDDIITDISILSLSPSNSPTSGENSWFKQQEKLPQEVGSIPSSSPKYKGNNNNVSRKFPPPLTTISGSKSLQFRPHREDGRLVIQAVEAPSKHTYFQAERSNGRLRLSFLRDQYASIFDSQLTRAEETDEPAVLDDGDSDQEGSCEGEGVDFDDDFLDDDCCEQLEEEEEDDDDYGGEEEEMMTSYMSRDMDGNIFSGEVAMGREKFQRLPNSRCNGGGQGSKGLICNWPEALWVATS